MTSSSCDTVDPSELGQGDTDPADALPVWQNPVDPLDVNNDGRVTPRDVLIIISVLNAGTIAGVNGRLPDAMPKDVPAS